VPFLSKADKAIVASFGDWTNFMQSYEV